MTWVTKLCLPYTRGWFPTTVLMALICTISVQKATTGNYVFLWLDIHVSLSKSQNKTLPRVIHKFVPVIKWLSLTRLTLASKLICMYFQSNSTPLAPTHRGTRRVMISSAVAQPKIKEKIKEMLSLIAKPFLYKMTLICIKMKVCAELIFIRKVSHLDWFWNRGTRELGNGQTIKIITNQLLL